MQDFKSRYNDSGGKEIKPENGRHDYAFAIFTTSSLDSDYLYKVPF